MVHGGCVWIALAVVLVAAAQQEKSFVVDPKCKCFLKDGHPFRYISGSLHYFRVPRQYWHDRMMKLKAAGLDTLQTYVDWSGHEPEPGVYNFDDQYDIVTFLKTAAQAGMLVVFRPGPYICSEHDFGGLPYWLLRDDPNISIRTHDQTYMNRVTTWFNVLLPLIRPMLYENGGPIITVQVENEYGQFSACDGSYMTQLRDLLRLNLGPNVPLFRTNIPQASFFACDHVDGVFATADFGSGTNVNEAFSVMRKVNPDGPLVVTEYYPGWMDHWGEPHANTSTIEVCKTLDQILAANASVNFYMFHGGTNFGFSNGANAPYAPQPTSYDYGAPVTESGDLAPSFFSIREVIGKYKTLPPKPSPEPTPKLKLGPISLQWVSTLLNAIPSLNLPSKVCSSYPKNFEEMGQAHGFSLYSTYVDFIPQDPATLHAPGINDRAYIFVQNDMIAIISRNDDSSSLPIKIYKGENISFLVENQGRINYGQEMHEFKGLTSNVTLDGHLLTNWVIQPIPLNETKYIHNLPPRNSSQECSKVPGFFTANFTLQPGDKPLDSFLDPTGWCKGVAFLNGFNLGRYWPVVGPQVTLYVPGVLIKPYPLNNTLTVFELEEAPADNQYSVSFVTEPILNGPTPEYQVQYP